MSSKNVTIPIIAIACCDWVVNHRRGQTYDCDFLGGSKVVSRPTTNNRSIVQPPKWRPLQFLARQLGSFPGWKSKHGGIQVYGHAESGKESVFLEPVYGYLSGHPLQNGQIC